MEKFCLICGNPINRGEFIRGSKNYTPKRAEGWLTCGERCSLKYKIVASRIWGQLIPRIKQLEENLRVLYSEEKLRMKMIKEIKNTKEKFAA